MGSAPLPSSDPPTPVHAGSRHATFDARAMPTPAPEGGGAAVAALPSSSTVSSSSENVVNIASTPVREPPHGS